MNEDMRDAILTYVRQHPGTSFVELERLLGDQMKGDRELALDAYNIVLWQEVSPEFCRVINDLKTSGDLVVKPTSFYTYLADHK